MQEFDFGNWASRRKVRIDDDNSVSVMKKDGTLIRKFQISEIAGIFYTKPNLVREGLFAFCESYEDTLITTWTTIAAWPHGITVTKSDVEHIEVIQDWFEKNRIAEAAKNPFEFYAKTTGSFVALDGNTVVIRHTGFVNQISRGGMQGEKRIPVKSILSVQFKKATDIAGGYIQFETAGGSKTAARGGLFEAAGDENSVIFSKTEMPAFEAFRDKIDQLISTGDSPVSQISQADELSKFAKLRDEGVISEDEFAQKKKQILGL
jgi:predicted small secreted protein